MTAHEIVTLDEAKARGLKFYFTGQPCKNGSVDLRRVNGRRCVCAGCVAAGRAAAKKHREANPEKNASRVRSYVEKNRDAVLARKRQLHAENRQSNIMKMKDWRAKNAERVAAYANEYRQNNVTLRTSLQNIRRARKLRATPPWLTAEHFAQIASIYAEARRLTEETGILHHVDHIVPLQGKAVCGLHVPWNLQPIPANDNLKKSNKHEWTDAA